jgi:hypothetical protein
LGASIAPTMDGSGQTTALTFGVASGGGSVTERMRLDNSGNLLVGKTSDAFGTAGVEIRAEGRTRTTRDGGSVALFNRLNSDGNILEFYKDSTGVGTIGSITSGGSQLRIGDTSTGLCFRDDQVAIVPANSTSLVNNTTDLGNSAFRFKDLYLGGGVFLGGTGDANKLDDYEEGTWTPTPSAGTISHNSYYTKIGRLVTLHAYIHTFSNRTSSDLISFTGMPFQVAGNSWSSQGIMARYINAGGDSIVAYAQSNATSLKIFSVVKNTNYVHVRHNHLSSNSSNLFVTITYLTD